MYIIIKEQSKTNPTNNILFVNLDNRQKAAELNCVIYVTIEMLAVFFSVTAVDR